jgi:hypothetical protein
LGQYAVLNGGLLNGIIPQAVAAVDVAQSSGMMM